MTGGDLSRPLAKPKGGSDAGAVAVLPGPFQSNDLGPRLAFFRRRADDLDRARSADRGLTLRAEGSGSADSSPLAFIAGKHS